MLRPSKRALTLAAPASAVLLAVAHLGPASPAVAESGVPCVGVDQCTDHFNVTGGPQFWTVPEGVHSIELDVAAGSGGSGGSGSSLAGGVGGHVTGTVVVTAGEQLALFVGDRGEDYVVGEFAAGGFGGGGTSESPGGGGGGGSFVFIASGPGWDPLLVAGGGGGRALGYVSHEGGAGGYSTNSPDAVGGSGSATSSSAGYPGGQVASFNDGVFAPGEGQWTARGAVGFNAAGGGGYYGGGAGNQYGSTAGGGGSGYASPRVVSPSGAPNIGAGFIEVTYGNSITEAELWVEPSSPVVGEPIVLRGEATHYSQAGEGVLTFGAWLDGIEVFSEALPVTVDSGSGPLTGLVETEFVAQEAGAYIFTLGYSGTSDHDAALASDASLAIGEATVLPIEGPEELAETGASESVALGIVGAGLLSGGAILFLLRRRVRANAC